MAILTWILSWLGGGPLSKALDALNKAYSDKLNAVTEGEKIAANERIDRAHVLAADVANARAAAAGLPWWMALLAFLFGIGFALHSFFIAMGTAFAPIIVGGWLDWWLHIPKLPNPYDQAELGIIGFFFGFASVSAGAGAIASAIVKRKS
jgi:uncharacterized membrane protein